MINRFGFDDTDTNNDGPPKKPKYWYVVEIEECVLCGREDRCRYRVNEEPIPEQRYRIKQNACDGHFM